MGLPLWSYSQSPHLISVGYSLDGVGGHNLHLDSHRGRQLVGLSFVTLSAVPTSQRSTWIVEIQVSKGTRWEYGSDFTFSPQSEWKRCRLFLHSEIRLASHSEFGIQLRLASHSELGNLAIFTRIRPSFHLEIGIWQSDSELAFFPLRIWKLLSECPSLCLFLKPFLPLWKFLEAYWNSTLLRLTRRFFTRK
ncbi:hypothetical protein RJT34_24371 [Clitoria ternatea]|uniref:Uncharacterized protein n=1 Tax=Clitoria ternatea TaxID=43366 RepID=A0AAN9IFU1_CLITE